MMVSACALKDLAMRSCARMNKDLICFSERELVRARDQDVMTSISSAKEEDEHLEMDIDLSISSQHSEKEDEHIENARE